MTGDEIGVGSGGYLVIGVPRGSDPDAPCGMVTHWFETKDAALAAAKPLGMSRDTVPTKLKKKGLDRGTILSESVWLWQVFRVACCVRRLTVLPCSTAGGMVTGCDSGRDWSCSCTRQKV